MVEYDFLLKKNEIMVECVHYIESAVLSLIVTKI